MQIDVNIPGWKFTMAEVSLTAGSSGTQFGFPQNFYLTGKRVMKMEVYLDTDITYSPISNANATWDISLATLATITMYGWSPTDPTNSAMKGEWIKYLPVNALHRLFNTDGTAPGISAFNELLLAGFKPDWNNSFITFVRTQTFVANTSALFGVWYTD